MCKKLSIAICDDHPADRMLIVSYITNYLDQHSYVADLVEYDSGEDLLSADPSVYDLIILDIFMDGINGIQTAKTLAEAASDARIIFCSSSNEFAAESYDVSALRYLTKPLSETKLYQTLDHFFTAHTAMRTLEYRANRMNEQILLSDVLWIEADDHKCLIHTKHGILPTTTTLTQFTQQLADADFVKPIRYALVSLAAVATIPTDVLSLNNGTKIPISRDLRDSMKKAFTSYKTRSLLMKQRSHTRH